MKHTQKGRRWHEINEVAIAYLTGINEDRYDDRLGYVFNEIIGLSRYMMYEEIDSMTELVNAAAQIVNRVNERVEQKWNSIQEATDFMAELNGVDKSEYEHWKINETNWEKLGLREELLQNAYEQLVVREKHISNDGTETWMIEYNEEVNENNDRTTYYDVVFSNGYLLRTVVYDMHYKDWVGSDLIDREILKAVTVRLYDLFAENGVVLLEDYELIIEDENYGRALIWEIKNELESLEALKNNK